MLTGAFGAHGLRSRAFGPDKIRSWETASAYMIYNGLGLLSLSTVSSVQNLRTIKRLTVPSIVLGTLLFSGSIFALVLLSAPNRAGKSPLSSVLGPTTPIGGLIMIGGWLSLVF